MPDNFKIKFCLLIIDSIIDDFSQRFDKESMQLFHLASQFISRLRTLMQLKPKKYVMHLCS